MKQIHIIFFLLAVIIVGALFSRLDVNEKDRAHELELKREGERLRSSLDSASRVAEFRTDSIVNASEAKSQAEVAKKDQALKTEIKRRKRAEVKLITYQTDLERDSALSELYTSLPDSLTYPTPINYFDSLTYETKLGRACGDLSASQDSLIQAQEVELEAGAKLTDLQGSQIANFEFQLGTKDAITDNLIETHSLDKAKLKSEKRKLRRIILAESVGLVVLVLLLL